MVNGSEMKINIGSYANWESTQVIFTISAIIHIKVNQFPAAGTDSNIAELHARRSVALGVDSNGQLKYFWKNGSGSWDEKFNSGLILDLNTNYFIRFTYSRSDATKSHSSFIIEIEDQKINGSFNDGKFIY